jgi:hypothetical protein
MARKCPVCAGKKESIPMDVLEKSLDGYGHSIYTILPCGHGVLIRKERKKKVKIYKLKDILKEG